MILLHFKSSIFAFVEINAFISLINNAIRKGLQKYILWIWSIFYVESNKVIKAFKKSVDIKSIKIFHINILKSLKFEYRSLRFIII